MTLKLREREREKLRGTTVEISLLLLLHPNTTFSSFFWSKEVSSSSLNMNLHLYSCIILYLFFPSPSKCNQVINFIDPGSFMELKEFPKFLDTFDRPGGSLSFSLRTSSMSAVLFYALQETNNSLITDYYKHYILIEIVNGRLELSINDGTGIVSLQSESIVTDGFWHDIEVKFSPSLWVINVDGKTKELRPSVTTSKTNSNQTFPEYLSLNTLFVGGIDVRLEFLVLQQGLRMIVAAGGVEHSSLVGCIKDIRVNRKPLGIKESSASRGISASKDCIWKFVCLLEDPCVESAECYQNGFDGFHCVCDENDCTKANYSSYLSSSKSRSNSVSFSTSIDEDERKVKQTEYTDQKSKPKKLKKQDRGPVSSSSPPSSSSSPSSSPPSSVTSSAVSSGKEVTLGKEYTPTLSIEEKKNSGRK